MMDQIFKPPVRRRRGDGTSETSSNKGNNADPISSPARNSIRGLANDEPARRDSRQIKKPQLDSINRSRTRTGPSTTKSADDEEIASPAVKNISKAKVAKTKEEAMRSSSIQLAKIQESQVKLETQPAQSEVGYKIKLAIFFLVSLFFIFNAMTPARRAPAPKRRH